MASEQKQSKAKEILARSGVGNPPRDDDMLHAEAPPEAGTEPQSLVDMLRQNVPEADFDFEPPRLGDIVTDTSEEPE
ncbi:hypothetical protein [Azospirillum sp. TSO22-1]|uniref:hypothetical protein n=1 Tax=Azospirillum sp. TSO22-1 TaxID=716789 RepID=UPI0011B7A4F2|nr:hypothetical protein [Azospirillum sp. TSO22-1]